MKKLLGVAVIAYNRPKAAEVCAESIMKTIPRDKYDFSLVCSIDQKNITGFENVAKMMKLIPHKNYGVAVNKSIAMYYLQNCDHIFLVEDDAMFVKEGWVDLLLNIQEEAKIGLINFTNPKTAANDKKPKKPEQKFKSGTITFEHYHTAAIMSITRDTFEKVGILNPKFRGYGYGHCEYTKRCYFAGKFPSDEKFETFPFVKELWDYLVLQKVENSLDSVHKMKGIKHNQPIFNECVREKYISLKEIEPYLPESVDVIQHHLKTKRFWSAADNKLNNQTI